MLCGPRPPSPTALSARLSARDSMTRSCSRQRYVWRFSPLMDCGYHPMAAFLLVAQPSDTDLLIRRRLPIHGLLLMQKSLTAPGKGLLAIDESNATAGKRLHLLGSHRHCEVILPGSTSFVCHTPSTASNASLKAVRMHSAAASMDFAVCNSSLLGVLVHVADLLPRPAGKRLDSIGVENTQENRRAYRTLLLSAPGTSQN